MENQVDSLLIAIIILINYLGSAQAVSGLILDKMCFGSGLPRPFGPPLLR